MTAAKLFYRTLAIGLLAAAALALAVSLGHAQQQPDPVVDLNREWAALELAQQHTETAINRVIAAYEARLATAMEWLKAAQDQAMLATEGKH